MTLKTLALTTGLALAASTAAAVDLSSLSLDLTKTNADQSYDGVGESLIGGEAVLSFGPSFTLNLNGAASIVEDGTGDTRFGIEGRFALGEGKFVGVYQEVNNLAGAGSMIGKVNTYGLSGGIASGDWSLEGFLGKNEVTPLGAPADLTAIGLDLGFQATDALNLGLFFTQESNEFENNLVYGATVGYQIGGAGSTRPVYLLGSFSRYTGDFDAFDTVSLTLSVPLSGEVANKGRRSFNKHTIAINAISMMPDFGACIPGC